MIIKAYITKLPDPGDNIFQVRIPFMEDNTNNRMIFNALLCNQPGCYEGYSVGDCVFVAFENNKMNTPIILGKLYVEPIKVPNYNLVNNLVVTDSVTLPEDTKIGNYSTKDFDMLWNAVGNGYAGGTQPIGYHGLSQAQGFFSNLCRRKSVSGTWYQANYSLTRSESAAFQLHFALTGSGTSNSTNTYIKLYFNEPVTATQIYIMFNGQTSQYIRNMCLLNESDQPEATNLYEVSDNSFYAFDDIIPVTRKTYSGIQLESYIPEGSALWSDTYIPSTMLFYNGEQEV